MGKLGFGLMRLPKKGELIDDSQVNEMVDLFLASGGTYFDTAYVYPGSEEAAGRTLVARHPRESYTLATKVNAMAAASEEEAKDQLRISLERTGAGYFDYYLLHALQEENFAKYEQFHLWDFARQQREKGVIRRLGFSFHGGPDLLDRLLTDHPEAEFVQLQINYADWEDPKVAARANYETARRHNKPVVIMEPVKGGRLADPPAGVKELFREHAPGASPASWAIRFAASLEGVLTVLSGMSDMAQLRDNLASTADLRPLDEGERRVIRQAQDILRRSAAIPCTACRYCTEGCPRGIPIPEIFAAMNKSLGGQAAQAADDYRAATAAGGLASECVRCGQCERACPQHLPVADHLERCARALEGR